MAADFARYLESFPNEDLVSFEALCFHKAGEVARPYTALMNAPRMIEKEFTAPLVLQAWDNSKDAIARAYETETESGAEIFAYAIGRLLEMPGSVPGLIGAINPKKLDLFECNIQQEHGGALDSTFTHPFSCGLTWDWYHLFEDSFGEETWVTLSGDHLTEHGVAFALWLWPERIEALRKREEGK